MQLINEGETLAFNLTGVDGDGDGVRMGLSYDAQTPAGVFFDPVSGYFEWSPSHSIVDNATDSNKAYNFTFTGTDGKSITSQTVQVRVFDVNRAPRVSVANHAVVVGNTLTLPVQLGARNTGAIVANDADGAVQTQALNISFTGLPKGASYDAQTRRLSWTPGPGQVGDFTVTARASNGRNTVANTFTLRVVAESGGQCAEDSSVVLHSVCDLCVMM